MSGVTNLIMNAISLVSINMVCFLLAQFVKPVICVIVWSYLVRSSITLLSKIAGA